MTTALRLRHFFAHELWTMDLDTVPRAPRLALHLLRLILAVAFEVRVRLLDARAAGLVYTTLLSLVPFLAVMFSVLKAFGAHQQIEPLLNQVLEPLGPKGAQVTGQIIGFINNLKVGVLGAVGVAGLFYTTYSLIDKIEQALNAIWRVRQGRTWARKFTDYLSVVLVGPVLIFTAIGLIASVQSHALIERLMAIEPFGTILVLTAELMPFALLCGVFTFLYKFVPNTRVAAWPALIGGITAALLWGIAGEAFAAFVAASGKYSAIYSGFAVLVLFLLWLYVGWLIVLVGAQVSFFAQHPSAYRAQFLRHQDTPALRERLVLNILVTLGRRALRGEGPMPMTELAQESGLPPSVIEEQIIELVDQRLLARTAEPEGIALIKPPELMPLHEILTLVRDGHGPVQNIPEKPERRIDTLLRQRDAAVAQSLAGMTLRSLITGPEQESRTADSPEKGRTMPTEQRAVGIPERH
ncbi:MAG: YihY/virulence factor BrkB family protein [Nitrospiraceae bacterium]|nr:YihY/virulence factor BrkB family protein [Nitrospiraceae bacterium]